MRCGCPIGMSYAMAINGYQSMASGHPTWISACLLILLIRRRRRDYSIVTARRSPNQ